MLKVHRLVDMDRIEREASEWIARLNADDVSAGDRARFEAWRRAHPLHARAYDGLSATWREFTAAGPLVRAVSFGQSMNEAAKVVRSRRRWRWAAAAAVAIVAAGLAWHTVRAPGTTFETAVGEHSTISLPDGSTLELNSNSLARIAYSKDARVIRLERGEAFFRVIHDAARPFWVVSDGTWVRDVGTAFNVDLRGNGVRVTVSEGTVKVGAADAGGRAPSDEALSQAPVSVVSAGQEVDMHGSAAAVRTLRAADIARTEAWRSGTVYFEKQPLSDVVEEIGRYSTLRLIVNDEKLRQLPVGGTFQANPQGAEAFLTMLKDGFGVNIRRETGRVYIESGDDHRAAAQTH
jgi:transmembrane sensor